MQKVLSFVVGLGLTLGLTSFAFAEQPLIQQGKRTVFQRVVSNPGAVLYADPSGQMEVKKPRTFTSFYVYARQNSMVRVGVSAEKADGWMRSSSVTEWPQAITMVFTDQMARRPVLFFRNREALVTLCQSNIKQNVERYLSFFENGKTPPSNSPVIASEPLANDGQVARKDFYLIPVTNIDTQFNENGTQLLEVACLDPGLPPEQTPREREQARHGDSDGMTTGIVFVVDTTISMGPYIEETKEIIRNIYDTLQNSPAKDKIAIAVVGFRSNPVKRPQTEYNTLIVSDFTTVRERQKLEGFLDRLEECQASTHAFDEDSLSGVKTAIDALSWNKVDAKIILLVTDAGPLAASDPTGNTGMSPEGMADYLRMNGIFLTAVHIKAPSGKKDHAYAEKSYKALSLLSNNRSSYIPIIQTTPSDGPAQFKRVGDTVASIFCKIAENQMAGRSAEKPKTDDLRRGATPEEMAQHLSKSLGYAMQLRFVGDKNRTTAPSVVKAWIADADLIALEEHPSDAPVPAVYPAVLLTKLQLSQLRKQLKLIIHTAEEAFLRDSEQFNFYEQLISAAAQMNRDPTKFSNNPKDNLAKQGVLLEVLDGLPYKSRILGLKKEDWANMSTGEQQDFIKHLKALVRDYENYDRDNTNWESFGSTNPNESVYRVPLSELP